MVAKIINFNAIIEKLDENISNSSDKLFFDSLRFWIFTPIPTQNLSFSSINHCFQFYHSKYILIFAGKLLPEIKANISE